MRTLILTAASARAAARKALAERYGKAFRLRRGIGYGLSCAPAGITATCDVKWRYNGRRHQGRVYITRTEPGDIRRTAVRRTRPSR